MIGLDAPFQIQFAARCPLPGDFQSVPRAELYAIYIVVSHVFHGIVRVISDSEINISKFYQGKAAALASVNFDIWEKYLHTLNYMVSS